MLDTLIRYDAALCRFMCSLEARVKYGAVLSKMVSSCRLNNFRAQVSGSVMLHILIACFHRSRNFSTRAFYFYSRRCFLRISCVPSTVIPLFLSVIHLLHLKINHVRKFITLIMFHFSLIILHTTFHPLLHQAAPISVHDCMNFFSQLRAFSASKTPYIFILSPNSEASSPISGYISPPAVRPHTQTPVSSPTLTLWLRGSEPVRTY